MDNQIVYSKTAKGLAEATGKTKLLSRDVRNLLKEIDGSATIEVVQGQVGLTEKKFQKALEQLLDENYIRVFDIAPKSVGRTDDPEALGFSTTLGGDPD